jgi:hypothetical protein
MVFRTLMYVSSSQIGPPAADDAARAIVTKSIYKNGQADLSGALVLSGRYFVQILEGPEDRVGALCEILKADARHTDMIIINDRLIERRKFASWRMAFVGPSIFVDRQVNRLASSPSDGEVIRVADWLETLLAECDPLATGYHSQKDFQ